MKVITNHLIPYMKDYQNKGWVRLHRKIEDNPLWLMEPFTKAQSWIDLFLNANYKDGQISIRGNFVLIKRGQVGWSELTMARRWRWSKNKVRRFLKWLETEQQIVQQKDRYLTTIITILNYETYQNDTADDTAERQQTIHKQEVKKEKNILSKDSMVKTPNPQIELILSQYKETMGFSPTDKKPRMVAQNIRQIVTTFIKEMKPYHEFDFDDTIKKAFKWYAKRDEIKGETLDVFKRKLRILLDKSRDKYKGGVKQ